MTNPDPDPVEERADDATEQPQIEETQEGETEDCDPPIITDYASL